MRGFSRFRDFISINQLGRSSFDSASTVREEGMYKYPVAPVQPAEIVRAFFVYAANAHSEDFARWQGINGNHSPCTVLRSLNIYPPG